MQERGLQKLLPIDFKKLKERIEARADYLEALEENLFDADKISSELLDVKLMKYDKAKRVQNDELNYLLKVYTNKSVIDPELANLFKIITSLDSDMQKLLRLIVKAILTGNIQLIDVVNLLDKSKLVLGNIEDVTVEEIEEQIEEK